MRDVEISGSNPSPPRKSFGFTRDDDLIILKAVRQPGADPIDPEFWETLAMKVAESKILTDNSTFQLGFQLSNGGIDISNGFDLNSKVDTNIAPKSTTVPLSRTTSLISKKKGRGTQYQRKSIWRKIPPQNWHGQKEKILL
jgi:hypothetical protein